MHQIVDNRATLPGVRWAFPLKNLMELHVKNLILTVGIASVLLIAACGKKEEAAAPAAAPATEAPATTAPANTDAAAPAAAPATTEAAPTEKKEEAPKL